MCKIAYPVALRHGINGNAANPEPGWPLALEAQQCTCYGLTSRGKRARVMFTWNDPEARAEASHFMASKRLHLLLTCEHAGQRIPREYAALFKGAGTLLASHRGWDPGALEITRSLARRLRVPFHHVVWSRLLVESNRAPSNSRIWSAYTSALSPEERRRILDRYWWPHRRTVENEVRAHLDRGETVLHLAIHSFTPTLDGITRRADIGLLYDPARKAEKAFCLEWLDILRRKEPGLHFRRNYPYRGRADGLTTWLRKRCLSNRYLGLECEINQALVGKTGIGRVKNVLAESLREMIG